MMIEFNTGKAELLFVKLPDDATKISVDFCIYYECNNEGYFKNIPKGNYKLLSSVKEIDENKWREIAIRTIVNPTTGRFNIDVCKTGYKDYQDNSIVFKTATESGLSLLRELKIYTENPYGEYYPVGKGEDKQWKWQQAQERTGNWQILIRQ